MKRLFLAVSLAISLSLSSLSEERPHVFLKAQYNHIAKWKIIENGDTIAKKNDFILQIAKGKSLF